MGLRHLPRLLLVPLALALAGCGAAGPAASTLPSGAKGATTTTTPGALSFKNGGTATVAISALPRNFNPLTVVGSNAATAEVMASVWPQLFVVGGRLPPSLACPVGAGNCGAVVTSAEVVSLDPQVVQYQIDPRATWSDGAPITSSDFINEWQQELHIGASLPASNPLLGYQSIRSISPPGSKSVRVTFATPYADWTALFSPLVPAHITATKGWTAAFRSFSRTNLVSGGPFEVTRVVPGRELVLSRNPRYWGPPAHLAHVIFRVEATPAAALAALADGKVAVAELPPSRAVSALVNTDSALSAEAVTTPLLEQLDFNLAAPALGPLAVREAIAKSLDRQQLLTNTVGFSSSYIGVDGNRLYLAGAPGSQGNGGQYQAVDLDEAAALLKGVGYHFGADGLARDASGAPFTLTLTGAAGDGLVAAVELQIQAELLQVGITVRLHNVPLSELLASVLAKGDYQLALAPYVLTPYPSTTAVWYTTPVGPSLLLPAGTSPTAGSAVPSSSAGSTTTTLAPVVVPAATGREPAAAAAGAVTRDVLGYEDPAVGALFSEAAKELNLTADASLYNEIDTDLWAALPSIPLFQVPMTLVTRAQLVGVSAAASIAGPTWNAAQWAIQLTPLVTTTTSPGAGG